MFLEYTLNALELHCDLQVLICLNQSGSLPLLPPLMFLAIAPLQCTGFGQGVVIANRPAGTPQSTPPLPLFAHCLISVRKCLAAHLLFSQVANQVLASQQRGVILAAEVDFSSPLCQRASEVL